MYECNNVKIKGRALCGSSLFLFVLAQNRLAYVGLGLAPNTNIL